MTTDELEKLTPDELQNLSHDICEVATAAWNAARAQILEIQKIRSRKLALAKINKTLDGMNDIELAELRQVLAVKGIDSEVKVSSLSTEQK